MRFGCCLPTGSFVPQIDEEQKQTPSVAQMIYKDLRTLYNNGFDFAEMTVGAVAKPDDAEFASIKEAIEESKISVPVFNSFIPGDLKLTGPSVDQGRIEAYLAHAIGRVHAAGGELIIFGSGGARTVPEGFPMEQAYRQIDHFLSCCDRHAEPYGITICIEPLNRKETNIINTVQKAADVASSLGLASIKVLADAYHMFCEQEDARVMQKVDDLAHIHIAEKNRGFPGTVTDGTGVDFAQFFEHVRAAGYQGRLSMECKFSDLEKESKQALEVVRKFWNT